MQTSFDVSDAFTGAECARIIALATGGALADAGLVGGTTHHNMRRADIAWLDERAGSDWVTDRIVDVVRETNRKVFDFDLRDFAESAQVARYGADRAGHFDWHSDIGDGPVARRRKLTVVVQLSDPDAYEGGALELMPDAHIRQAPRRGGTATLFASFVLHRVTPVEGGARYSLTQWAHGPAFR